MLCSSVHYVGFGTFLKLLSRIGVCYVLQGFGHGTSDFVQDH